MTAEKRKYRNGVSFVVKAVRACCNNALGLAEDARNLLTSGNHALALSIAILSLEELGKATMIDGLLLAKPGDYKTQMFEQGHRRHPMKLERIPVLHIFVLTIAQLDPRWKSEPKFKRALAISIEKDRNLIKDILERLGSNDGFAALDSWKQRGFYVNVSGGGNPQLPSLSVPKDLSDAVVLLSHRLAAVFDFVMRDNYELYENMGLSVRKSLTDADHDALERAAHAYVSEVEDSVVAGEPKSTLQ